MNEYEYNCKYCSANFLTKKLPLNSTLIMDQRPQRKKTLSLRFQDLKINNKIAKNIDKSEKINDNLKPEVVDSVEFKSDQISIDNKMKATVICLVGQNTSHTKRESDTYVKP